MYTNLRNFLFQKIKKGIDIIMEEDSTKYGEFISSYFAWVTLEEQKEIASRLEDMTR